MREQVFGFDAPEGAPLASLSTRYSGININHTRYDKKTILRLIFGNAGRAVDCQRCRPGRL